MSSPDSEREKGYYFGAGRVVNGIGAGKVVLFWRRMGGVRNWRGKGAEIPRGGCHGENWRGKRVEIPRGVGGRWNWRGKRGIISAQNGWCKKLAREKG